jgi:hypothetical protein
MTFDWPADPSGASFGVLRRDLPVRLLNISGAGCLLEAASPLESGVTGSLEIALNGAAFSDAVRVTRCQSVALAGSLHRIGVEFLWADRPGTQSLRLLVNSVYMHGPGRLDALFAEPRPPAEEN